MIPVHIFKGRELGVFGLGETGLATALALKAGGAYPIVGDESPARREAAREHGLVAVDLLEVDWTRFLALVISPGVRPDHPVAEKARMLNIPVIGDIEVFAQTLGPREHRKSKIIAVTGTNGKSITTALIGHILQRNGFDARVGGSLVVPALAMDEPGEDTIFVLELSSFQLESTFTLAPDVGVLINLTQDHMDRHGSMEAYAAVKARIFAGQQPGDAAVIGIDDDFAAAIAGHIHEDADQSKVLLTPVSVAEGAQQGGLYVADGYLHDADQPGAPVIADLTQFPRLPGQHNWQNIACAIGAVRRFLPDMDAILAGVASFPGIADRMEIVATVGGVWFVNDSKATNFAAAARAIACYESVYWIGGGRLKDDNLEPLAPVLSQVRKAYLIGEAAGPLGEALHGRVALTASHTLDQAVVSAFSDALKDGAQGSVVLFSPACTSFDQYPDFAARGEAFRTIVRALETTRGAGPSAGQGA